MKIDMKDINPAFQSVIQNPEQTVFLDANFFIPPDRSNFKNVKPYTFDRFKVIWLIPLLNEFSGLAIHESVYDELVADKIKAYADELLNSSPQKLKIHYDSELSNNEVALMNHYITMISIHSQYDPHRDNAKDRGEVRSLSYMAVKQFLYFAANDALPVRLVKDAGRLNTGLDDMGIVQMYELIYFLHKTGKYDSKELRTLYKYQYYLSSGDKRDNPEWGMFIEQMEKLYESNE
ncbi:MAG TPA: hypothetical protein DD414_02765 [Lachnospiraceae bacterium]|nr:hypothetical protein [Lachnospiraceae bacterium]